MSVNLSNIEDKNRHRRARNFTKQ